MKNHFYRPAMQGFWNFTQSQGREIQAILSVKSCEIW